MTATTTPPVTVRAASPAGGRAITRLALRQVRRGAAIVAVVCAGMSAVVAATYETVIAGAPGGAQALAALAANPAIRTLFGEPVALDTAGGFTVWRVGIVLAVLVGTWAVLATGRVLRGEEDSGRWDLLLAGRVALPDVVGRHLGVLTAAVVLPGVAVTAALLAAGTDPAGAAAYGASLALIGVLFVGAAGLAAQLWPGRGTAVGAAVAVLVVGLLARMVGDGVEALNWLRWLSPFGLAALARPYDTNRVLPLVVLAVAASALLAGAVAAARRRDVRGGVLSGGRMRRSHLALLGSLPGFAVRSVLRQLTGWTLAVGAYYLLVGLISKSVTGFLLDNPQFAAMARQAGFELDVVEGFAATLFTLLAVPIGGFAAVRIAALAHSEAARRLDLLLAAPITRTRLLAVEATTTAAAALVLTLAAALATWTGTAIAGAQLGLGPAIAGALNTLPVTALGLAAAVLALGWAPRAVVAIGMLPAAGGFLLIVVADSTDAPAWIAALSPFDHLALVPTTAPNVPGAVVMVAIAAVLVVAGAYGYHRRDIRGD
jgi:ABC-2 type transport system permease protein